MTALLGSQLNANGVLTEEYSTGFYISNGQTVSPGEIADHIPVSQLEMYKN